jgi:predicted nuclease of predicted toxin-antitoxin system
LKFINSKPKIILDVPLENLKDILLSEGYDVSTVTEKLGSTKEKRDDENILKYAQETNSVVITLDRPFVSRLRSKRVKVAAITLEDKASIINKKLDRIMIETEDTELTDAEILDGFNKIKSGEASRMAQK